jgi:hypothetical protein
MPWRNIVRYTFSARLGGIAAAFLLSCAIAGIMTALTSPVTADSAGVVTISVNRSAKGDRLPLAPKAHPTQHNSISIEKPTGPLPLGCEPAFSPFVDPTRSHIPTYCTT